ncbi:MAG: hypothetical protein JW973_09435 [Bacteroidales bacterium]|nr:hypothetical protein [Bacteroidales bacterium]
MRSLFLKYWYVIMLSLAGLAGGFLYWKYIGCQSGSCPITSHWHSSTVIGGIIGYLSGSIVFDLVHKKPT